MFPILQVEPDILGDILNVGGILSTALAVGLMVLWKEYKATKQALSDLNESMRKDAVDNIKIIDTLTNTIDNHSENSDKILNIVTESLAMMKAQERTKITQ